MPRATDGQGTYDYYETMKQTFGGQALRGHDRRPRGEQCLKAATIQISDLSGPSAALGRTRRPGGGSWAPSGSRPLVIDGRRSRAHVLRRSRRPFPRPPSAGPQILKEHPVTGQGLPGFGTAVLVNIINEAGGPCPPRTSATAASTTPPTCPARRSPNSSPSAAGKTTEGLPRGLHDPVLPGLQRREGRVRDLRLRVRDRLEHGSQHPHQRHRRHRHARPHLRRVWAWDTIEMGNALGVGPWTAGALPWGDGKAAIALLQEVGQGLAPGQDHRQRGPGSTGRRLRRGARGRGQEPVPARLRSARGQGAWAWTYATTPMGRRPHRGLRRMPEHPQGGAATWIRCPRKARSSCPRACRTATARRGTRAGFLPVRGPLPCWDIADAMQTICDLPLGKVRARPSPPEGRHELRRVHLEGTSTSSTAWPGFTTADDQLPRFFSTDKLPPHDVIWDFTADELQAAKV